MLGIVVYVHVRDEPVEVKVVVMDSRDEFSDRLPVTGSGTNSRLIKRPADRLCGKFLVESWSNTIG